MYSSFIFGRRFLLKDSPDLEAHADIVVANVAPGPTLMIREIEYRNYFVEVKAMDGRVRIRPMCHRQLLAPSAADWPEWFSVVIELLEERL